MQRKHNRIVNELSKRTIYDGIDKEQSDHNRNTNCERCAARQQAGSLLLEQEKRRHQSGQSGNWKKWLIASGSSSHAKPGRGARRYIAAPAVSRAAQRIPSNHPPQKIDTT